jgi:hypothetical protein
MNSSFEWFMGVIEDRIDPEKLNRVKVRCFGIHDESISLIPTEDLPWATVMLPTTSSGMNGLQSTPHGLVEGSWVVGFFRDGNGYQDPVVMGSIASMPMTAPVAELGFNDPNLKYPKETHLEESDVNRLARAEDTEEDIPTLKKDSVTKEIPTATDQQWDEPETPYAPEYPFNKVYESESGHIFEIDDTEGVERLHEYHRTGTFREVHPDGSVVTRVVKDTYEIVYGNSFVNVKGNVSLTIDSNCETYIKGNWDIKVDGNVTQTIGGTLTEEVAGDVTETYNSNQTTKVSSNVNEDFGGTQTTKAGGNIDIDASKVFIN